jgi:hypothetical protein
MRSRAVVDVLTITIRLPSSITTSSSAERVSNLPVAKYDVLGWHVGDVKV